MNSRQREHAGTLPVSKALAGDVCSTPDEFGKRHDYFETLVPLKRLIGDECATPEEFDKQARNDVRIERELRRDEVPLQKEDAILSSAIEVALSKKTRAVKAAALTALFEQHRLAVAQELRSQGAASGSLPASSGHPSLPAADPSGQAYTLYKDRPLIPGSKRRISAREHFDATWRRFVSAGLLYMDELRKRDRELVAALYLQESYERRTSGATWKVRDLIPTRSVRADRELNELERCLGGTNLQEMARLARVERMRRIRGKFPTDGGVGPHPE